MEHTHNGSEGIAEQEEADSAASMGAKKVERIAQQSKGLIDDVKDWVDLKIQLLEMELQEKVFGYVVVGVVGVLALVFFFITIALGLGLWLGHPFWGFLIVTGVMVGVAGLTYWIKIARGKPKTPVAESDQKTLPPASDQKKLPPGVPEA